MHHVIRDFSPIAILFVALVGLGGCAQKPDVGPESAGGEDTPVAIATIPMIADIAKEIAGPHIDVQTLLDEKTDPHTYQPNAADIKKLTAADAVLYNGLLLEGAIQADLEKQQDQIGIVVAVGDTVSKARLRTPPDFDGHPDPHIWMDPSIWASIVPPVLTAFQQLSPDNADDLATNARRVEDKLRTLDAYAQMVIASIPAGQRHLVTAHDAFGYMAAAYDFEVSSVQGVTTESEAGLEDVQNLVDLIVEKKIPAIFFESSVPERSLKAIIDGVRAAGHEVVEGGTLYSDSVGPPGSWEGTYFGMIDHNVNTLARSLGGSVPDGGFRAVLDAGDAAKALSNIGDAAGSTSQPAQSGGE